MDFKNGLRNGSAPRIANDLMIKLAKAVTDEEFKAAAAYFASIKPRANIVVVETDRVPKTQVKDLFLAPIEGSSDKEPIGQRIIENPGKREKLCEPRHARSFYRQAALRKGGSWR